MKINHNQDNQHCNYITLSLCSLRLHVNMCTHKQYVNTHLLLFQLIMKRNSYHAQTPSKHVSNVKWILPLKNKRVQHNILRDTNIQPTGNRLMALDLAELLRDITLLTLLICSPQMFKPMKTQPQRAVYCEPNGNVQSSHILVPSPLAAINLGFKGGGQLSTRRTTPLY